MNNLSLKHSLYNRIVSFILCGVMVLCGIGTSVFAENGSMPASLNSEAKYSFLEKLGIFNNVGETELSRETVVSREILALLYARLSYQESSLSHISGSTNINDLDKESPFYPYVCLAVDNGVMSAAE